MTTPVDVENDKYFSPFSSPIVQDIDTASASDDIYCLVCNKKSNHLTYPEYIPHQKVIYESLSDEVSDAHLTHHETTKIQLLMMRL